jgi:hypothetical protein
MSKPENVSEASMEPIVRRLEIASRGVSVWRIMTPDGKGIVDQFSEQDCVWPAHEARDYLKQQQAKGYMHGHFVAEARYRDHRDRLMHEAAEEIKRLELRVSELESHLATTIEMKTK